MERIQSQVLYFTPHVNGKKGCYQLSQDISLKFHIKSLYYSGSAPKYSNMSEKDFSEYKNNVQKKFKANEIPLLVATKAFGSECYIMQTKCKMNKKRYI